MSAKLTLSRRLTVTVAGSVSALLAQCHRRWLIVTVAGSVSQSLAHCHCRWLSVTVAGSLSPSLAHCHHRWLGVSAAGSMSASLAQCHRRRLSVTAAGSVSPPPARCRRRRLGVAHLVVLAVDERQFEAELGRVDPEYARPTLAVETVDAAASHARDVDGQVEGTDDTVVTVNTQTRHSVNDSTVNTTQCRLSTQTRDTVSTVNNNYLVLMTADLTQLLLPPTPPVPPPPLLG